MQNVDAKMHLITILIMIHINKYKNKINTIYILIKCDDKSKQAEHKLGFYTGKLGCHRLPGKLKPGQTSS